MKILFIGDVVGRSGRLAVRKYLSENRDKYDFVICNGENSAAGFGITDRVYKELLSYGVDVITGGNHTWDKKGTEEYIGGWDRFIRPANSLKGTLGAGFRGFTVKGENITVINLIGRVYMGLAEDPFSAFDEIFNSISGSLIIVDFHGDATAEKAAFASYADGRAAAVFGTHTHVQTNDMRILPNGTLFLTDAGMCGGYDSVIGMEKTAAVERFISNTSARLKVETKGDLLFNGAAFSLYDGKICDFEPIKIIYPCVE